MVTRIGGFRKGTRNKLRKNVRTRGKISLTKFFQTFNLGDKVILNAEPAYQKGMYFPRFHGKIGIISKKIGTVYEVSIKDINKSKTLIVHPVHLKSLNN
jgi:large subunit ribosomal protein L21e